MKIVLLMLIIIMMFLVVTFLGAALAMPSIAFIFALASVFYFGTTAVCFIQMAKY